MKTLGTTAAGPKIYVMVPPPLMSANPGWPTMQTTINTLVRAAALRVPRPLVWRRRCNHATPTNATLARPPMHPPKHFVPFCFSLLLTQWVLFVAFVSFRFLFFVRCDTMPCRAVPKADPADAGSERRGARPNRRLRRDGRHKRLADSVSSVVRAELYLAGVSAVVRQAVVRPVPPRRQRLPQAGTDRVRRAWLLRQRRLP